MKQYTDLIRKILAEGRSHSDRTGHGRRSIFGHQMRFDLSKGFPLVTNKFTAIRPIIHELLWFLSGDTNIKYLLDNNVHIWDQWAVPEFREVLMEPNERFDFIETNYPDVHEEYLTWSIYKTEEEKQAWLIAKGVPITKKVRNPDAGALGPVYGAQMRSWPHYEVFTETHLRKELLENGAVPGGIRVVTGYDRSIGEIGEEVSVYKTEIDQIAELIQNLKEQPFSSRHVVSCWNVGLLPEEGKSHLENVCNGKQALPPCFHPDTLVNLPGGFSCIDMIDVGDMVLSGTGIPRRVNHVWKTWYKGEMLALKCMYNNQPIRCTPNHPFLIKGKGWVTAGNIEIDDLVAIPKPKGGKNHIYKYNHKTGENTYEEKEHELTINDYFTFGYFLGNGWFNGKERVSFAIPHVKVDRILPKIRETIKVSIKPGPNVSCATYETRSLKWGGLLKDFGRGAYNKTIPEWVFTSSKEAILAFIEGYMEADGNENEVGQKQATTISPRLAYGLQRLLTITGMVAGVHKQKRPPYAWIEGRRVSQNDTYNVRLPKNGNRTAVCEDEDYMWLPVIDIKEYQDELYVYNLDVDVEHTYLVNNIVNHNCHTLFQFFVEELTPYERHNLYVADKPDYRKLGVCPSSVMDEAGIPTMRLSCQLYARSQDVFLGTPFNIASYALLTMMIAQCVDMIPGDFIHTSGDTHLYLDHLDLAEKMLAQEEFPLPTMKINPAIKNINDFKFEDFELIGYKHGGKISAPVAV